MHELAIIDSKQLIQSVKLSYARYKYYEDNNVFINMDNYRKLFVNEKQFKKRSNMTKSELLNKYDYSEYIKEIKNGKFI